MKTRIILILILFFGISVFANNKTAKSGRGTLIVEVVSLKSNKGIIRSHLYDNSSDFPTSCRNAVMKNTSSELSNHKAIIVYKDVPYGEYAMTTHHDENNNGKMDKTWIGMPDEGWGVSNDAEALIALPDYDDAKFVINSEKKTIKITMRY